MVDPLFEEVTHLTLLAADRNLLLSCRCWDGASHEFPRFSSVASGDIAL